MGAVLPLKGRRGFGTSVGDRPRGFPQEVNGV